MSDLRNSQKNYFHRWVVFHHGVLFWDSCELQPQRLGIVKCNKLEERTPCSDFRIGCLSNKTSSRKTNRLKCMIYSIGQTT